MKKSLSFLLASLFIAQSGFAFTNPTDSTINSVKKGANGRRQGEQAAVIMLVRNPMKSNNLTTLNINSEDAVVYDLISDDGVTVRFAVASADGAFAGIAVTTILSSDAPAGLSAYDDYGQRNWGYILIHGKCTAKVTAGGTNGNSTGQMVITSRDAGSVTTLEAPATAFTMDSANVMTQIRASAASGGFFYMSADGTSTSYPVQIDLE